MAGLSRALRAAKLGLLSSFARRPAQIRVPGGVCSISFDDAPVSAFEQGLPLLDKWQARATYYLSGSLLDQPGYVSASQARELAAARHDIACHTFSHYRLSAGSAPELAADAARNRACFEGMHGLPAPADFSYPFGQVSIQAKRLLARDYRSLRSVYAGLNGSDSDLAMLRANPIFATGFDLDQVRQLAAQAARLQAWLIFYTHSVEDAPDAYSCTPAQLDSVLQVCSEAGLAFRTVREMSDSLTNAGR